MWEKPVKMVPIHFQNIVQIPIIYKKRREDSSVQRGTWSELADHMMRKCRNRGSAVIEVTLLMPVFLGCIYFYIMLFLFLIQSGQTMDQVVAMMYPPDQTVAVTPQDAPDGIRLCREGGTQTVRVEQENGFFHLHLTLARDGEDTVRKLRRWQFVTDLF
ncbi:MAG: hypothetical protein IJ801_03495 [Lachnospiraceae bacterium]|nr:hypothetical protein [Lachnospiraceae bacterium]